MCAALPWRVTARSSQPASDRFAAADNEGVRDQVMWAPVHRLLADESADAAVGDKCQPRTERGNKRNELPDVPEHGS